MPVENFDTKSAEGFLDALLNSTVMGVFLYQDNCRIILSNKTFRDFIGYSEDELKDLTPYDIIPDEYKASIKELAERRIRGEVFAIEQITHAHKTKEGFLKSTVIFAYTVYYQGKPAGLVLVFDVSKQKMNESLISALKNINQLIITAKKEDELLSKICKILAEEIGFRMVAIGNIDEGLKLFQFKFVSSSYGETLDNLRKIKISVDENLPEGGGAAGEAYRTGNIVIIEDSRTDPRLKLWREEYLKRNIYSTCAIPIKKSKKTEYILLIQSETPGGISNEYVSILKETQADISFALEHLEQEENIKSIYRLYATLSEVNQLIVRAKDENFLFSDICNKIVEKGLFVDSLIVLFDPDFNLKLSFSYGKSDYINYLKQHLNTPEAKKGPLITAFSKSKIAINNNTLKNPHMLPWKEEQAKRGYFSSAAIPIIKKNKTIGVFSLYAGKRDFFKKDTYDLLKEIMTDINYALDKIEDQKWHSMISVALNAGLDFVIIADKYFNLLYANESTNKIFGYTESELVGEHYSKILEGGSGKKEFAEKFLSTLLSGETLTDIFIYKTKDKKAIYGFTSITPFKTGGDIEYYIAVGKDITHEIKSEETIEKLLHFDALTDLPNKKSLAEKIGEFINAGIYSDKSCALVIINPINFSFINHTFGVETGNQIMSEIAGRIKKAVKGYDIPARWEADKFAVFLKNLKLDEDALHITNRILKVLGEPYIWGNKRINISFNAGISLYPKDAKEPQDIFNKAEAALLNAKTKGENTVGFFKTEFQEYARKRVELRNGLMEAIVNKEFILHYQPYFDAQTGIMKGAEALLRWKRPDRLVPPMDFIPFLEQSGIITEVENWIIDRVASRIKIWLNRGFNVVPIALNISPVSFGNVNLKDNIIGILEKNGVNSKFFTFEIVERTFIENFEYSVTLLNLLKKKGFSFSIDDFGTGYSSLSYLADLPFDNLKIDISFVKKMLTEKHSRYLVETIIYLSKKLNMKSVAEGVETEEQLSLLKSLGCDYIQGFLLSKPLEEDNFEKLLAT